LNQHIEQIGYTALLKEFSLSRPSRTLLHGHQTGHLFLVMGNSGDIHDKKCQEENGDFPLPSRMPPVVKLNPFFPSNLFYSFQWANLMIRRPDIHLRYSVTNATGHSG